MRISEQSPSTWSRYSPAAAAAAALLAAGLLVAMQVFGDPQLLSALWGDGPDRVNVQPHGTVASFGVQDVSGSSGHIAGSFASGSAVTGSVASSLAAAAAPAPAPGLAAPLSTVGNSSLGMDAILEEIIGAEVVYTKVASPKAVLLLFHGCFHSAQDWGRNSSTCSGCLGLPEEMAIVKVALGKSYVPVAFSSSDKENRCWDAQWLDKSTDIAKVKEAFGVLSKREGWEKLPVYALGASSGASMVLFLAMRMQLDGIVPQIMSLPPHMLEAKPTDPSAAKTWQYPPVYFMHMELDRATAQRVTADINVLKTKQGAWVTEKVIRPRAITPKTFMERVDGIDEGTSVAVYKALKGADILNATDFLKEDPRVTKKEWQPLLAALPGLAGLDLQPETSPIFEELNLAWARHELISDHVDEVLDWLDARRRDASAKLLAAVKPRRSSIL